MVFFSNCKINLGLQIIGKRSDGFHNLETCFYPIPFYDVIEIIRAQKFEFTNSGLIITATAENNLCVKAYQLLKADFPTITEVKMHLHKNIPMGAGIGGGSANAAFVIKALQKIFNLQISNIQLEQYAAKLGSDCAFFINNKPCIATGRGEILEPFNIDLSCYHIILIFPEIHVSTKDAFENILPKVSNFNIGSILNQPTDNWKMNLQNDFEASVFKLHPSLAIIKEKLYNLGALYASMSGSGSALYAIFSKEILIEKIVASQFEGFKKIIISATK